MKRGVSTTSALKFIAYIGTALILSLGYDNVPAQTAGNHVSTSTSIGKSLYEGAHEAYIGSPSRIKDARDAALKLPAAQAACIACHRASGLGSFEGGISVPPIAGHLLFESYDTATTKRYGFANTLRVRPAYDEASLRNLLATGRTPDGLQVSPLMPRYDFTKDEVHELAQHLRILSATRAPGVTDDTVLFATITTEDVAASDAKDLLDTLNAFLVTKNAGTRGEFGRRAQAQRKEQTMYLRHRNWQLRHWQLKGTPESWGAQLDALWRKEPVFAVLTGLSGQSWQPVHDFCARTATPCLLPMVDLPPQEEDFYSIYFSRGLVAQAEESLRRLQSASAASGSNTPLRVSALTANTSAGAQQREALAAVAKRLALQWQDQPQAAEVLLSTLPKQATEELIQSLKLNAKTRILLGGALNSQQKLLANSTIESSVSSNLQVLLSTDYQDEASSARSLTRTRAWFNARQLKPQNMLLASNAVYVATLAVESLMHVDDKFSREYCIEKLEHNLENIPPMTAYERLSIGPKQRFASKQVHVQPLP